jgi:hypothetical protein
LHSGTPIYGGGRFLMNALIVDNGRHADDLPPVTDTSDSDTLS